MDHSYIDRNVADIRARIDAAAKESGFVLITAPEVLADKVREEILRILHF